MSSETKGSYLKSWCTNLDGQRQQLLGLFLGVVTGILAAVEDALIQFLQLQVQKSNHTLSVSQLIVARSIACIFGTLSIIIVRKVPLYNSQYTKQTIGLLLLLCFCDFGSLYCSDTALIYIPVGDSKVFVFSMVIFTAILGCICLKQQCFFIDIIMGILTLIGIIIMAKPMWFGIHDTYVALTSLQGEPDNFDPSHYEIGVLIVLVAAFLLAAYKIITVPMGTNLDIVVLIFYPAVFGLILSPILMRARGEKFLLFELTAGNWVLLIFEAVLEFISMAVIVESLQLEHAGLVTLVRCVEIVVAFILQVTLIKERVSWVKLTGAIIVVSAISFVTVNRWFGLTDLCWEKLCHLKKKTKTDENCEGVPLIAEETSTDIPG